ncbi:hypothetical protein [Mycobacterium intracellulare]|uniref:hypothetical protein n=1 Tax=Mycobacterium intracellulare TaxID=1767 RepID=UPI002593F1DD|nr:hypothetical protein [Mycobacterium intracellulare]MDM3894766.1 hypothetical protein [Mycobacterium intracellulare]
MDSPEWAVDAAHRIQRPDGTYPARELMEIVKAVNMERAESIAEAWGTDAALKFPWA